MKYLLKTLALVLWFVSIAALAAEPVDINTASAEELQQLQGVGPVIAERIVIYRETHGAFRSLDELTSVRGISTNVIEQNKSSLSIEAN